jgi:hypothetical protein
MRILLVAFALVALALPATAQDSNGPPGCVQANPCEVIVNLDAQGIDLSEPQFEQYDWILLSVFNNDKVPHTITLDGHPTATLTVAAGDIEDTQPFEFSQTGTYVLHDAPSGDGANMTVTRQTSFSDSTTGKAKGLPGMEPALLLAGIALAVAMARRRA